MSDLSDDGRPWREERLGCGDQLPGRASASFPGAEVEALIRQYQLAGPPGLSSWLDERREPDGSLAALHGRAAFLDGASPSSKPAHAHPPPRRSPLPPPLRQEGQTPRLFQLLPARWKVRLLFYLLRHPRPSYRTRDLRAHLAALGVQVSTKDIRRFCSRHGIRRDMRAGRPRTRLLIRAAR